MKIRNLLAALSVVTVVVGCASTTTYYPPDKYEVTNKVTIDKPFDTVWKKLLVSLSGDFFVINNIEKDSGIINVSFSSGKPSEYVDCGVTTRTFQGESVTYNAADYSEYKTFAYPNIINIKRKPTLNGRANILLQPDGKSRTDVTVNARYVLDVKINGYFSNGRHVGNAEFSTETFTTKTSAEMKDQEGSWECRTKGTLEKTILDYVL